MNSEWRTCQLGDLITFQRGYDLPKSKMNGDNYPVVGSNGIIGYHNKFTTDEPSITIGRSGNVGNPFIYYGKTWSHNTTLFVKEYKNVEPIFIYYLLKTMDLKHYAGGTAVPTLNRNHIHNLSVKIPCNLEEQKKISSILKSFDDKIELNNQINKNLEQQAQAIFKSWFIDFEPFGGVIPDNWIEGKLGDFVDVKRGGSPRPIQKYLSDSGLRWLKISDVTSLQSPYIINIKEHIQESGLNKTVFLKSGSLVLSNSATPGIPKFLDVDSCIHDGWLYFPNSMFSNEFLYLYFKYIRNDLLRLGNGSIFINLKIDIVKGFPIAFPDKQILYRFNEIIIPLFNQMRIINRETHILTELRNILLPKLMSGEIDVSDVDDL